MFLANGNNPIINSSKIFAIHKQCPWESAADKAEIIFAIGEQQVFVRWRFDTKAERDAAFEGLAKRH